MLEIIGNGQTNIDWIPIWFAQLWRVLLFIAESWLLGNIFWKFVDKESELRKLSFERKLVWVSVMIFVLRSVIISIQEFSGTIHYENTPITTVAVIITIISIRKYK